MKKWLLILILFLPVFVFGQQQLICSSGFEVSDPSNPFCLGFWDSDARFGGNFRFGNNTSLDCGNTAVYTGERKYAYFTNASYQAVNSATGYIIQSVTIPANTISGTFSYYISVSTNEAVSASALDILKVGIVDPVTNIYTYGIHSNMDGIYAGNTRYSAGTAANPAAILCAPYILKSFPLPANFQGLSTSKDIYIKLEAQTNASNFTIFRVDDVRLTVTTCPTPSITTQPTNNRLCRNSSQIFSITTTNTDSYQWQFSLNGINAWQNIANATSSSYTIPSVQTVNEGYYRCVASRSCGTSTVSNPAYLKVDAARPLGVINSLNEAQKGATHLFYTNFDVNTVINWNWTFQNASPASSTDETPSVIFNRLGSQNVTLTVSNACGATSTGQTVQVKVNPVNYPKIKQLHTRGKLKADPVNTATGAYTHVEQALSIKGVKNLNFQYNYNGLNADKLTTLGYGWEHSFEYKLDVSDPDVVTAYYPNGTRYYYQLENDSKYTLVYKDVADSLIRHFDNSFTLLQRDSTRLLFDATGKITSIFDAFDNPTTFSYTGNNQLRRIESAGRGFDLIYNNNGRLGQVSDGLRTVFFEYDGNQDLIRSIVAQGTERDSMTYEYQNHLITRIRDPRGIWFLKNEYVNDKVAIQRDAYDKPTQFIYPSVSQPATRMIDPMSSTSYTTHDDNYNLIQDTDEEGRGENYTYYDNGSLKTRTDANGNTSNFRANYFGDVEAVTNALNRTSNVAYNNLGLPTVVTDMLSRQTRLFYKKNQVDSVILPNGGTIVTRYNATGRPLSIKDPKGNVTTFVYHPTTGDLISVTTAAGTYNFGTDRLGRLETIQEGNDATKIWFFQYNHRDQITRITSPMSTFSEKEYDRNGNVLRERDFSGFYTTYEYDLKDRLTLIRNPKKQTTRLEYDDLDRIRRIYDAENALIWAGGYNKRGDLTSDTTVLGITNYAYENNRLLNKTTNTLGKSVEISYNSLNLPKTLTDELGRTTTLSYNNGDELERETYADNTYIEYAYSKLGLRQKVRDILRGENNLKYDLAGNLDTVLNALNKPTLTTYDAANRPIATNDGITRQRFGYTLAGLDTMWDGNGVRSLVTRNKNNEVLKVERTDNSFEEIRRNTEGFAIAMKNDNDSTTIERDSLHLPIKIRNGWNNQTQYTWTATQQVKRIDYPSGQVVERFFKRGTHLIDSVKLNNRLVAAYVWDSLGQLKTKRLGNATTEENTFDAIQNLTQHKNLSPNRLIIQQNKRVFNAMNRVESDTIQPLLPKLAFGTTVSTYGDDDGENTRNGVSIRSDGNGNIVSVGNTEGYVWRNDKLVSFRRNSDSAQIAYDATGMKIKITRNGQEKRFVNESVVNALPVPIEERDNQNRLQIFYVFGANNEPILRDSAGIKCYYHFDAQGNVIALTDSLGNVTDRYAYDDFGAYARHEGASVQPFQFLGMYGVQYEAENLYYVRARWLDVQHNRFLSKDPFPADLTNTQSNNRFVYAFNNPVSWVDASGLKPTPRLKETFDSKIPSTRYLLSKIDRYLDKVKYFNDVISLTLELVPNLIYNQSKGVFRPLVGNGIKSYSIERFSLTEAGRKVVNQAKFTSSNVHNLSNNLGYLNLAIDLTKVGTSIPQYGLVSNETSKASLDVSLSAVSILVFPVGIVLAADNVLANGYLGQRLHNGVNWAGDKISNWFIKK